MKEIELKFVVDPACAAAVDAALRRGPSRRTSIESHYLDTDDRRLARAGLALRLRKAGKLWEQTLKAPGDSAVERHEETAPRPGKWGPEGPRVDPALHAGTPAGALLDAALNPGDAPATPLRPVHVSIVTRRTVEVEAYGARVEVAFDQGLIRAGAKSEPVCEVEYELKSGDPRALVEFGRAGVIEHGLWLSTASKSARGDLLAREDPGPNAVKAQAPRLGRAMPGPEILRAVLKNCLDHALANAGIVADGRRDDEAIHQLRIGLRRLRTAARELGPLSAVLDPGWEAPVIVAFRALGHYRDRVTVAGAVQSLLRAAGSPEPTLRPPTTAAPDPVDVVRDKDFQCALLDVLGGTLEPPQSSKVIVDADRHGGANDALRQIGARLARLHGQMKRSASKFELLDEPTRHRVRKRLKRLRYLAELVGPLYKAREVKRYLERLRPAQDALGTHIDLLVARAMAREAADSGDARAWFNVGWLTAQVPASARRCRKALVIASGARRFWR